MYWLLEILFNVGMAIGPITGYVYQYRLIMQRKSVGTFSINICGMLLFCNILRIGFYFFSKYSTTLLVQSICMIIVQVFLLRLCVQTMKAEGKFAPSQPQDQAKQERTFLTDFWWWDSFSKYLLVIGPFALLVLSISLFFSYLELQTIGQLIGYLSLISESLIMMPQVIQNHRQRRVKGLSHLLVACNNFGDTYKLVFFIIEEQPIQFIVCGVIQVFVDGAVIVQILYFGNGEQKQKTKNGDKRQQKPPLQKVAPQEEKRVELIDKVSVQINPPGYHQFQDERVL